MAFRSAALLLLGEEALAVCSVAFVMRSPWGPVAHLSQFIELPEQGEDLEWFEREKGRLHGAAAGCGPSSVTETRVSSSPSSPTRGIHL